MPLLNASDVVATTSETDKIIYCGCMEDKTAAASHPQHCIGRTGDELTHVDQDLAVSRRQQSWLLRRLNG